MRGPRVRERKEDLTAPIIFGIFMTAGMVFIIVAKLLGLPSVLVTTVPVLLMLGYAAMIVFARALRLRNDQTGDNFYYMGFIFTLVSLGVSLIQYSSGAGVDEIIRNFGIAVASTIAGIILRIVFNQIRRDPVEVETVTRLELADAAKRVRRELDSVILEITHFRRSNQQMVEEGYAESRHQIASVAKSAAEAVESIVKSATDGLEGTVRELTGQYTSPDVRRQLERSSKSLDRMNGKLEAAGEALASAVAMFAARLGETQTPDKVVEVQMQPVVDRLEAVILQAVERLSAQTQSLDRLADQVVSANRASQATRDELGRALRAIEESTVSAQQRGGFFGRFRRADQQPPLRERDAELRAEPMAGPDERGG